ncbi:nicotinate-nucleotide adenylyltransferase [Cypionkella sp.]|jgi:nicotinate-nucleotide adenylyltransferase|uniref:nicotinate-nucleotide adenylyltransferase n=1 Tax=Cypionkella sp. TaxID=2811411 RepID=UPI002753D59F|nr:nicotinate-nucleotide adenylyltransferase [Cypionkella sp.]
MRAGFPIASKGMVIGLLGGSFDPAHEGHVHLTRQALARMGLDRVWWLVTPGNPLKARQPAPMAARLARARALMTDPRVKITDLEAKLGTRATIDTLERLQAIYPGVHFVWLMGADNLVQFHKWSRWRDILRAVPVGVLARPGLGLAARTSVAARAFGVNQIARGENLRGKAAPAWCFVNMPMKAASSSAIRARGAWKR